MSNNDFKLWICAHQRIAILELCRDMDSIISHLKKDNEGGHSVVFGVFSAESLAERILDCQSDVLLSCSSVQRGNKALNLKAIVDQALQALHLCKQKENFTPGEHISFRPSKSFCNFLH